MMNTRTKQIILEIRDKMTNEKGFWDAHHYDLQIRRDGKDTLVQMDVLKELIQSLEPYASI